MNTKTITRTITNNNNSCGLNPFCHIWRRIQFFIIMLILGIILHIWFVREIFKKPWHAVEWGELTKNNKEYDYKCCADYGCSNGRLKSDSNVRKCCTSRRINKDMTEETCETVNCKKWLNPCVDCNISKKYSVNGEEASFNKIIPRTKCDNLNDYNLGIPDKLYADPDNINNTTSVSKGQKMTLISILLLIWWIVVIGIVIYYYFIFKAGKKIIKALKN